MSMPQMNTAQINTPQTSPILEAHALSRHYRIPAATMFGPPRTLKALNEASFTLAPGKTLAVVGESGCGKSTLARLVTMIEEPTAGTLSIDGVDLSASTAADRKRLRPAVQMVFQDPYASLNPRKQVGVILEEPLVINTSLSRAERREKVQAMMAHVGLRSDYITRYPHMFSGGQRQRIAIARALMMRPKIVVADEPVSALDVSVRAQVLNLLMDLQEELNLAYLFISHDLGVVRHIADEVMVMYLGRPVEKGSKQAIFENPRHPYTRVLLSSTPSVDPHKKSSRLIVSGELPSPLDPPPGCAFHRRCPFASESCRHIVPETRTVMGRAVACHHAETLPDHV